MRDLLVDLHNEDINLQNYLIREYDFTEIKTYIYIFFFFA